MTRSVEQWLADIEARIRAIRTAEGLLTQAEETSDDALAATAFDAILYGLVVIGEAIRDLPVERRAQEPNVPWEAIIGMRNLVAHEYFRISAEVVTATLESPLSVLEQSVERMARGG